MTTRDELIEAIADLVEWHGEGLAYEYVLDGGIELPGGARLMVVEPATAPTDVGELGAVGYCTTHESPGLWFSDGSGSCMLEHIIEHTYAHHDREPLFRRVGVAVSARTIAELKLKGANDDIEIDPGPPPGQLPEDGGG